MPLEARGFGYSNSGTAVVNSDGYVLARLLQIWAQITAGDYHRSRVQDPMLLMEESYLWLAARHDVVVIEGAGSPAEINVKKNDIANMRIAKRADAACVLISDIDRRKYEFFAPISNPPACNTLEVTF